MAAIGRKLLKAENMITLARQTQTRTYPETTLPAGKSAGPKGWADPHCKRKPACRAGHGYFRRPRSCCPRVRADHPLSPRISHEPIRVREPPVGQHGAHGRYPLRVSVLGKACDRQPDITAAAQSPSLVAISSKTQPDTTDFGSVETGFRRASVAASSILISSQCSASSSIRCKP